MQYVKLGNSSVSRFCIGGNPFSGFSHQGSERDQEMKQYFTDKRIIDFLDQAEDEGINTLFARTDNHILNVLKKYYQQNGRLQWFAQICTDVDIPDNENDSWKEWMKKAVDTGATALYIHGGLVDYWYANKQFDRFYEALALIQSYKKTSGFAGHIVEEHTWINENINPDFQMCSYYNPTDRSESPHHSNINEKWDNHDRQEMLNVIKTIKAVVVHYKIFAGGNKPIQEAFKTLGSSMRKNDVVCIGIYPKDDPDMLNKDIGLFNKYVDKSTIV